VLLLFFSLSCLMIPLMGEGSVQLLFVQRKFDWTQSQLSIYSAYGIVITTIGITIVFSVFLRRWRVPDMILGALGSSGGVLKAVIIACTPDGAGWMLYLASSVCFFSNSYPCLLCAHL